MANYSAAARLRREIASGAPLMASPVLDDPALDEWAYQQRLREVSDAFLSAVVRRWQVTFIPPDLTPRYFHMIGSLAEVRERAAHIFRNGLITIEAAIVPEGPEIYDSRLTLSGDHK